MNLRYALLISLITVFSVHICLAQDVKESAFESDNYSLSISLDTDAIQQSLFQKQNQIKLPFKGQAINFELEEFSLWQNPDHAPKGVKSYKLLSKVHPNITGRLLSTEEDIFIFYINNGQFISYYPSSGSNQKAYTMEVGLNKANASMIACTHDLSKEPYEAPKTNNHSKIERKNNGSTRRVYRTAVVLTGEYITANGGVQTAETVAIFNLMSVSAIYENELAIQLVFAENSPITTYTNPATDVFNPNGAALPNQAANAVAIHYNASEYDLGHVLHNHQQGDGWQAGGQARIGVVCNDFTGGQNNPPSKAFAWSGSFENITNEFIALFAHEIAHQFNATHTFNGSGESCTNNIRNGTAYEIGSGTTIMSYNGICGPGQNIPWGDADDNYFHANSLERMIDYIENETCNETAWVSNVNTPPVLAANPCIQLHTVPIGTPFWLEGFASDADQDSLTYCWEQYDEDGTNAQGNIGNDAATYNGNAPLFRSYPPSKSPRRYFPRLENIGSNENDFEVLPLVPREMNFRMTVRDNNPNGGGVNWEDVVVSVDNNGPLEILEPVAGEMFTAGDSILVSWNPNGSENLCDEVDVRFSADGGFSYSYTLKEGIPYRDGRTMVKIPDGFPNSDRVKAMVVCADSECFGFFNVSEDFFTVESFCEAPAIILCNESKLELNTFDEELNLNLQTTNGSQLNALASDMSDALAMSPATFTDAFLCIDNVFPVNPYKAFKLKVDATGIYRFTIENEATDVILYSVYEVDNFSESQACTSFIGSNGIFNGGLSYFTRFQVELDPCKEYFLVAHQTRTERVNINVSDISGTGNIYLVEDNPDYSEIFVAVGTDDLIIKAVSEDSDFRDLAAGSYLVFAVTYKSGGPTPPPIIDPQTWIGESIYDIQTGGDCASLSTNQIELEVNSTCAVINLQVLDQSPCDPGSNTYSQLISFDVDMGPSSGQVFINGQSFEVDGNTIEARLEGLPADGEPVNLIFDFTENPECNQQVRDAFNAPESCCPIQIELEDKILACEGDDLVLDAETPGLNYEWSNQNGIISNEQSITISDNATITLTINNGFCSVRKTIEVEFEALPEIENIDDISACDDDLQTVVLDTDADSIYWILNNNIIAVNEEERLVSQAGLYTVEAVNLAGCKTSTSFNATYFSTPIIDLGDDISICSGSSINLDAGDPNLVYEWTFNGSLISETSNILNVSEAGEYLARTTTIEGCNASDNIIVTVNELPELDLGDNLVTCADDIQTLRQEVNGFRVEWYFNGTLIPNASTSELIAENSGEYVIRVIGDENCSISDTIVITYVDLPDPQLGDDQTLCEGNTLQLISNANNERIEWERIGEGIISSDANLEVSAGGEYILRLFNDSNCVGSDTIRIDFIDLPELSIDGSLQNCEGDMTTLSIAPSSFDIQWSRNNQVIQNETDNSLTISNSGTYTVRVSATPDCFIETEVDVVFESAPVIDLGNDLSPCTGTEVILDANPGGNYSYRWLRDNTPINNNQSSLEISQDGDYTVIATNAAGCESQDVINVAFIETPFVELPADQSLCEGTSLEIQAETNAVINWYLDGNLINGVNDDNITITSSGQYIAIVGQGAACMSSDTIDISPSQLPDFIIEGQTIACEGDNVDLSVDLLSTESIAWSGPGIVSATNENIVEVNTSGTYTAVVTNNAGCSKTETFETRFIPFPNVQLPAIPSLCEGQTFALIGDSDGQQFEWLKDGVIITGENDLEIDITDSGTYTLRATNEPGCIDEAEVAINFESIPQVSFDQSEYNACLGEAVNVNLTSDGNYTYQWFLDNNPISASSSTIEVTEGGLYKVIATNDANCAAEREVIVNIDPPPLLELDTEQVILCEGTSTSIDISTNAATIEWYQGNTLIQSGELELNLTTAGPYRVEVFSAAGCKSEASFEVNQVSNPQINISDLELCPGESMDISVDDIFVDYSWTNVNGNGAIATIDYQEVTSPTTESGSLLVTDNNGCQGEANFNITYFPIIEAQLLDAEIDICEGESVQLSAEGGLYYNWNPDATLSALDIADPIASPIQSTSYTVEVTDDCPNNLEILIVDINVNSNPIVDAGVDTCAFLGMPFELMASGGIDYQWDNDLFITSSTSISNPTIMIVEETTFTVTVTDENGCSATDMVTICVDDPGQILAVTAITPNGDGNNDQLSFRGLEAFPDNKLTIMTRWGNVIYEKIGYQADGVLWDGTVNGEELPGDVYYYILEYNDIIVKKSLTVIRN